jgi:uncharacterized protein YneF (UPF0154 family)
MDVDLRIVCLLVILVLVSFIVRKDRETEDKNQAEKKVEFFWQDDDSSETTVEKYVVWIGIPLVVVIGIIFGVLIYRKRQRTKGAGLNTTPPPPLAATIQPRR